MQLAALLRPLLSLKHMHRAELLFTFTVCSAGFELFAPFFDQNGASCATNDCAAITSATVRSAAIFDSVRLLST